MPKLCPQRRTPTRRPSRFCRHNWRNWPRSATSSSGDKQELADRALRLAAEFDNYRKRIERERADFWQYAAMEAVKAVLPVVDDFERALKAECADAEYARGMALIEQRLADVLAKLGLEAIETAGQPFDPEPAPRHRPRGKQRDRNGHGGRRVPARLHVQGAAAASGHGARGGEGVRTGGERAKEGFAR